MGVRRIDRDGKEKAISAAVEEIIKLQRQEVAR